MTLLLGLPENLTKPASTKDDCRREGRQRGYISLTSEGVYEKKLIYFLLEWSVTLFYSS